MKSWLISGSIVEGKVDFLVTLLYSPFRVFDPFGNNWEYSLLLSCGILSTILFPKIQLPTLLITHSHVTHSKRHFPSFEKLFSPDMVARRTSWQTCGYLWDHQSLSSDMSRWNVKSTIRWKLFNLTCAKWK